MSLSSTMWTSVSGLLSHGKKMNTIGNNIANINTLGYKGQRMDFSDFVYQDTNSLAGPTQNGFGVQVGAIMGNFKQGAFESSDTSTDLAINGNGFFQVQQVGSDQAYYTRAGNFRFNPDGYLNDPSGLTLQGWRIDNTGGVMQAAGGNPLDMDESKKSTSAIKGSGVPTDIKLDTWSIFPQQTTKMDFRVNLPKEGADNAKNTTNPFAALFNTWDGTQPPVTASTPPIAKTSYAEQTTLAIYDEAGVKHNVSVYFDKVSSEDYAGGTGGDEVWEYVVTMDPAEDKRQFVDATGALKNVNETKAGGMLLSGTMTFNSSGALINQSAYTWGGSQTPEANPGSFTALPDPAGGLLDKQVINLDPTDMSNWQPAMISESGYPMIVPNFAGILDAQTSGTAAGAKYNTEINFGVRASNLAMPWKNNGSLNDLSVPSYVFNPAHRPGSPATGPEYVLLNPTYDSLLADKWNPATNQYVLGGTPNPAWALGAGGTNIFNAIQAAPGTNPITYKPVAPAPAGTNVSAADYQKMVELYGLDSITLSAGSISPSTAVPPVAAIPDVDVKIDLLTGAITNLDGTPLVGAVDGGILLTTGTHLDALSAAIQTKMDSASIKGRHLLSTATPSNANDLAEFTEPAILEANASTNLGGAFTSSPAQDGYGFGDLTSYYVDQDGILYGGYSNGQNLPLWQLTMYDFNNPQGLRREGGNLFTQTKDSGEAKTGPAGAGGLGDIHGYSLEQSNVDMSTEFVYMISTQRGYQSNSKLITTTDQMLETVINMKR